MSSRRTARAAVIGYAALLVVSAVVSVGLLTIGAVVATTAPSEPPAQTILDYGFSALSLGLAVALLLLGSRNWATRLLAVAMIASAAAFNLQAHAAPAAVQAATGLNVGWAYQLLLPGIAFVTYLAALMLIPTGRWERGPSPTSGRLVLAYAGVGALLVVLVGIAYLPRTVGSILFFGLVVPLVGLAALSHRVRTGATAQLRTQARVLVSVLLAALGSTVVLGLLTVLLWYLGESGLGMVDPTATPGDPVAGQPTALLFWFSRLAAVGIAAAVLVGTSADRLWIAERVFNRSLVCVLVVVALGGGYWLTLAVAGFLPGLSGGPATVAAAVLAGLCFLPLYGRTERLVDRLLYGSRAMPYSVLAQVAALSRFSSADGPNLAGMAEAIGRALGARSCRLTVLRPGLRDQTYAWDGGAAGPDDHIVLPIQQGAEQVGTIAVDRSAVAGLNSERRHLLEDIAGSLGAILQASRLGIELERQLRAALAHAEDIAAARRQAVAEMDSERRTIERDLHDGAQLRLVTLRLSLGLVEHEVGGGHVEQARDRLAQLAAEIGTVQALLAETAGGVSSAVLSERGLVAALTANFVEAEPAIALDTRHVPPGRRFRSAVESAVYFCCLEAVSNARKHAPGASVSLALSTEGGALRFTIRDEGPGFVPERVDGSTGRGLRNVTARIVAVGGELTVRSAPGAGTTVTGRVPLAADRPVPVPVPVPAPRDEPALLAQVRVAVRLAREAYSDDPSRARLEALAARLDAPLPVGVVGPPGAGTSTLVKALSPGPPSIEVIDGPKRPVDALIVVGRHRCPEDFLLQPRPDRALRPPAIGVLARADEAGFAEADRAARQYGEDPDIRRMCQPVVAVAALLAADLGSAEYRSLQHLSELPDVESPDPDARRALLARFGSDGVRLAVELMRDGTAPTQARLSAELVRRSGLPRLRELVDARFARRADLLKARSVLRELDALVRSAPHTLDGTERLRYELERTRSGAHELAEIDLADALRAGTVSLLESDRIAAEQLLGAARSEPYARLGLAVDAGPEEIRAAAGHQLAHWQRLASHPASGHAVRAAAAVLIRTCEELLAHPAALAPERPFVNTHR